MRNTRIFGSLLFFLGILNILDYFFTVKALSLGADEANPVMLAAMETTDYLFPLIKLVLVPLGLFGVWLARGRIAKRSRVIMASLWVVTLAYATVTGWHLYGLYFS